MRNGLSNIHLRMFSKTNSLMFLIILSLVNCERKDPHPMAPVKSLPEVSTLAVTDITITSARCGGMISADGGAPVSSRGVCWDITPAPTIDGNKTTDGEGIGQFQSYIAGLSHNTKYYVRAYAINEVGVGYGGLLYFTSKKNMGVEWGAVTDIDGNTYKTVRIGDQWWMAENLRVSHYRNGDAIPELTDKSEWAGTWRTGTGACCEINNDPGHTLVFGRLYNWHAVNDSRGLAPVGWRISSDEDWKTLEIYLGMDPKEADRFERDGYRGTNEGGILKATTLWLYPNKGATNESGFSALPAGWRHSGGTFFSPGIGEAAFFWTTSPSGIYRYLWYSSTRISRDYFFNKEHGFSIRCIKN